MPCVMVHSCSMRLTSACIVLAALVGANFRLSSAALAAPVTNVIRVRVDGFVHPVTAEIIRRGVEQAREQNAPFLLITLNTPGGMLDATREAIAALISSPVPVVTYVEPSGGHAASAGFFLLEAGDITAMAPGTNTGAASPVLLGLTMDPVMRRKVENDAAALLRGLTSHRGRNSDLAEKAIRESKAFTEIDAQADRLIDLIATDEPQLLRALDGRLVTRFDGTKQMLHTSAVEVSDVEITARERLIEAIADPNLGFILLALGALGIYVEFSTPGAVLPGVFGGILAILGMCSLALLPINWTGVALLILAITLFVLEAKFTSHGVLGIGGAIAMVLGSVLLINGPPEARIRWSTAVAVTLPFAVITVFLASLVIKARRGKVLTGQESLMNEVGVARTALTPSGEVFVRGEYWEAIASQNIAQGERVSITGVDGMVLHVQPLIESTASVGPTLNLKGETQS
jgi:membrane-bound serine protease (ClpP class)